MIFMSMKRFIAAPLLSLMVLAGLYATGTDTILISDKRTYQENIQKYLQVQRLVLDHHVDSHQVGDLYRNSLLGMVRNLTDSTLAVAGTPLDTLFAGPLPRTLREAVMAFEQAYRYLETTDPDEDMDARTDDAILGMFADLDPHSIYLEPEVTEAEGETFAGKFEGIGVQFDVINDSITVVAAISGGPSERLGIRSGDRIVKIDGESSVGYTNQQVLGKLRGAKGTRVKVEIVRPGQANPLTFTIVRDEIPVFSVDAGYMLDTETGYIKIGNFAATTYDEFMSAITRLEQQGMKKLVIDLRGNPGGYLVQATRIAGEFFPAGTPLVSTKSRHMRYNGEYTTPRNGLYMDLPLIVLVNEGSASGSEILAGAIQDHDRGIIAGARTYGKGLVQNQFELVDKSSVRITISKYYTPSGRLIQKPYADGREAYAYEVFERSDNAESDARYFIQHVPDSLMYQTSAGRPVYGGGGVMPDHILQSDTTRSFVYGFMRQKNLAFDHVRAYLDRDGDAFRARWQNRFEQFVTDFRLTDTDRADFRKRMVDNGMVITDTVAIDKPVIRGETLYVHPDAYTRDLWIVEGMIQVELARQVWDTQHFYRAYNAIFDVTLKEAVTLWPEVTELRSYAQSRRRN